MFKEELKKQIENLLLMRAENSRQKLKSMVNSFYEQRTNRFKKLGCQEAFSQSSRSSSDMSSKNLS